MIGTITSIRTIASPRRVNQGRKTALP
jgi:hypothetical protein